MGKVDIDDSEAIKAAEATYAHCRGDFQESRAAGCRAYASNLRQQLAELRDYAHQMSETAQTFLREREEAYAKLERLERVAQEMMRAGSFTDHERFELLNGLRAALSTQEPTGAAGVVPSDEELESLARKVWPSAGRLVFTFGDNLGDVQDYTEPRLLLQLRTETKALPFREVMRAALGALLGQHRPAQGPAVVVLTEDARKAASAALASAKCRGFDVETALQAAMDAAFSVVLGQPTEPKAAGVDPQEPIQVKITAPAPDLFADGWKAGYRRGLRDARDFAASALKALDNLPADKAR